MRFIYIYICLIFFFTFLCKLQLLFSVSLKSMMRLALWWPRRSTLAWNDFSRGLAVWGFKFIEYLVHVLMAATLRVSVSCTFDHVLLSLSPLYCLGERACACVRTCTWTHAHWIRATENMDCEKTIRSSVSCKKPALFLGSTFDPGKHSCHFCFDVFIIPFDPTAFDVW